MRSSTVIIFVHLLFLLLGFSQEMIGQDLTYRNKFYTLELNRKTGSIVAIKKGNKNLLDASVIKQPLFDLRFRDPNDSGKIVSFTALDARGVRITKHQNTIIVVFDHFGKENLSAAVTINVADNSPKIEWGIRVDNQTEYLLDHIDFPRLTVKNDLVATGGSGRLFWPAQEGCIVEDLTIRERSPWVRYHPIEYPQVGWGGVYPNAAQMQFMAYYNNNGGLYLASHDPISHPKGFEFFRTKDGGIMLDLRLFAGGAGKGTYKLPYKVVTSVFNGDWHNAADIYRNWVQGSRMDLPKKLIGNKNLPEWFFESPVIVTYPVRGKKDMGDQTPNKLYPYTNALPYINNFARQFNSRIMALLMHWEGSAPWAPPYAWPPYGSEENYRLFIDSLHAGNNLVGLYASGIGYTYQSNTDTTYNRKKEYEDRKLSKIMKVAPDGTLATNGVCAGPQAQRIGWDMCPANDFVKNVVAKEVSQIAASGTDYIQYFDQNLGGGAYHCYGTTHGHSYGPGHWMIDEMQHILDTCQIISKQGTRKTIIGCEAAAAEPFMKYLPFNDARATINLFVGNPVPAYAYVYHEYINNFMGNQNGVSIAIDIEKSPFNLLQRLAYAFCAGDMLTVIIRDDGKMIWDWDGSWDVTLPDQKQTISLIKNMNSWRKNVGKKFLIFGKMLKPMKIEGDYDVPMIVKETGSSIHFRSVFTSHWEYADGSKAQFFVNYLPVQQRITVPSADLKKMKLHSAPTDKIGHPLQKNTFTIEPLSAVMISYR